MAIDALLIREGNKLVACDSLSLEAIQTINHNEQVTVTIRRNRNPKHHRKLFALLHVILVATDVYDDEKELLGALKLATGLFTIIKTVDGIPACVPKSINFASMDQTSFEKWYDKAIDVVLTRILPNVNKFDLEEQVMDIINGNSTNGLQ